MSLSSKFRLLPLLLVVVVLAVDSASAFLANYITNSGQVCTSSPAASGWSVVTLTSTYESAWYCASNAFRPGPADNCDRTCGFTCFDWSCGGTRAPITNAQADYSVDLESALSDDELTNYVMDGRAIAKFSSTVALDSNAGDDLGSVQLAFYNSLGALLVSSSSATTISTTAVTLAASKPIPSTATKLVGSFVASKSGATNYAMDVSFQSPVLTIVAAPVPQTCSCSAVNATAVLVTFSAVASTQQPVTQLSVGLSSSSLAQTSGLLASTATSYTFTGLSSGTTFTCTVQAKNDAGISTVASHPPSVTTPSVDWVYAQSVCSATCNGTRTRSATCQDGNGIVYANSVCIASPQQPTGVVPCNVVSDWSAWPTCSSTDCSVGSHTRTRTPVGPSGDNFCNLPLSETQPCTGSDSCGTSEVPLSSSEVLSASLTGSAQTLPPGASSSSESSLESQVATPSSAGILPSSGSSANIPLSSASAVSSNTPAGTLVIGSGSGGDASNMAIGVAVGLGILLVVIVILVLVMRRRRSPAKTRVVSSTSTIGNALFAPASSASSRTMSPNAQASPDEEETYAVARPSSVIAPPSSSSAAALYLAPQDSPAHSKAQEAGLYDAVGGQSSTYAVATRAKSVYTSPGEGNTPAPSENYMQPDDAPAAAKPKATPQAQDDDLYAFTADHVHPAAAPAANPDDNDLYAQVGSFAPTSGAAAQGDYYATAQPQPRAPLAAPVASSNNVVAPNGDVYATVAKPDGAAAASASSSSSSQFVAGPQNGDLYSQVRHATSQPAHAQSDLYEELGLPATSTSIQNLTAKSKSKKRGDALDAVNEDGQPAAPFSVEASHWVSDD
ncbi:hypothetical protein CAOG_07760 [Capsaspora owczarzaki ATCC 30864]|nr:hypothetical protein CAOG_07760 [Capsaspora owczarzaki ATCC 30864]|eukprot:XP_004342833.1 hypothetical protein CAOG_07760 [Capsaspora owczarzaki ATCC 30864]